MLVTESNVAFIRDAFNARIGNPYVYGGSWSPTNVGQGCDCSALVAHILNGIQRGPSMTYQRVDQTTGAWITTESWRPIEVGERGPFGTITVGRPQDIPADAACKIALHHGPGGGANSHMWCEFDGIRAESAGGKGQVTGSRALAITADYGNDWAYLPAAPPRAAPPPASSEDYPPYNLTDRALLEQIWQQLRGPDGEGWAQLGGLSVVDAIARLL